MYIVRANDHLCDILYHAYSWPLYSYVSGTAICICSPMQRYLYYTIGWLVLPPDSSSLHSWDGLIMYFSHHITPRTSHIRGHLLQLILPHLVNHTCMAFPCPSAYSLDPMDLFYTFYVSKIILKNMLK